MNPASAESLNLLTERVLGAVFEVANTLGAGFLEKVYQRSLLAEFRATGIAAKPEASFRVLYKGRPVGDYFADFLVEDLVVVELKCVDRLTDEHMAVCLNYLKVADRHVCLLVNFQRTKVEWRRIIHGTLPE